MLVKQTSSQTGLTPATMTRQNLPTGLFDGCSGPHGHRRPHPRRRARQQVNPNVRPHRLQVLSLFRGPRRVQVAGHPNGRRRHSDTSSPLRQPIVRHQRVRASARARRRHGRRRSRNSRRHHGAQQLRHQPQFTTTLTKRPKRHHVASRLTAHYPVRVGRTSRRRSYDRPLHSR